MPIWCPQCNAMLAEGTERCPRCGTHLKNSEAEEVFSRSDIAWFSAYTIGILVIMIIIGVGLGLLCFFLFIN
jgi:predicted amidophosphoribosyltransferase